MYKLKIALRIFSGALCFLAASTAMGQKTAPKAVPIAVLSRPLKDSILLRWAPETPAAWQALNKTGYQLQRITIIRDGKVLEKPESMLLTAQAIKPLPLAAWQSMVESNDQYAAVAAQALYGKEFEITRQMKGNIAQMVNQVKQSESRFSFALFSADQSFKVAKAMGLGYADKAAKSNEKYLYRVYASATDKLVKIDTGFVYSGFSDYAPLPKPYDLQAQAQDKGVMLSWNQEDFTGIYTTYLLERSEDGKNFISLSDAPVVNTSAEEENISRRAFKLDTVSALNRKLIYRVKGISPFGETGPPSDTISVTAIQRLVAIPVITGTTIINESVKVSWMLPESKAEVSGFDLERSDNPQTGFKKLNTKMLPPVASTYVDTKALNANYYRVRVYGRQNRTNVSFPVLVQLADSIPPKPPQQLSGEISKEGLVKLRWKANTEADLYGYRVYRSNSEKGEFSQVTRKPALINKYIDTIEVKTLTKSVYYKLVALDKRFNPSALSEAFRLKRPDVLPPVPPSLKEVKALNTGVYLAWNNSSSEDVIRHEVFRSPQGQENWKVLAAFKDTTRSFTDGSATLKQVYTYKIRATDDSQLSADSKPFTSKRLDLGLKPAITNFKATADRENRQIVLKWIYKEPGVQSYLLYKAEPGKPLRLYKTLDNQLNTFTDSPSLINTVYQYRLKAVFSDGTETTFTKEINVNY